MTRYSKQLNGFHYGGRRRALLGVIAAPVASFGIATCSQAASDDANRTDQSTTAPIMIEEISVTARRVSENLQTTGVSMAAFTAERLADLNITTTSDIAKYTPNFEFKARNGSGSQGLAIKIRGIGVSDIDYLASDPSVGVYIDGMIQARAFGPQFELFDVERVEVLRGPQGTLYGKNTLGGAVNIITRKPTGEDSAAAELTIGNYGRFSYSARGETALVKDTLFMSLAGTVRSRDGFYENTFAESLDPGDEDVKAVRGAWRWLPASNVTVDFSADYTRQRQHGPAEFMTMLTPDGLASAAISAAGFDPAEFAVGVNPSPRQLERIALDYDQGVGSYLPPNRGGRGRSADDADYSGASLTIQADLNPDVTLKSLTTYREFDRFVSQDLDGTPAQILTQVKSDGGNQLTQELQLNTSLFGDRLDLVVGAFAMYEDMHEDNTNPFLLGLADDEPALRGISRRQVRTYDNESLAGFAHAIYHATDRLRITGGLRYSWEKKSVHYLMGRLMNEGVFDQLDDTDERTFDGVTPKLGVEYELNDDLFAYATVSEGYASGGFAPRVNSLAGQIESYDQETLWSYEAGFKSMLFDRRLRFNLAAFQMEYDNIVIQSFGPAPAGAPVPIGVFTGNGGQARVQGIEAEIEFRPLQDLTVSGGFGYLEQKFLDFGVGPAGVPIDPDTAHFFDSPATTASAMVQYALPLSENIGSLTIGADWSYRGRTWFENSDSVLASQDPYSLYGARIVYTTPNERFTTTLFGENLSNEVYAVSTLNLMDTPFGIGGALFGAPRTYGVKLGYKF